MKVKKILLTALSLVLVAVLAIGGTLAYLTDRDAKTNVFTVGNVDIRLDEEFEPGAELIPGVDITKKPTVTNTGDNDAWVWVTIAIPAVLDDANDASANVIHFNYSNESVEEGKWNWKNKDGKWNIGSKKIGGIDYNVYIVCYDSVLKPGETTEEVITKVYLDHHIDIDPDGNLAHVENGVVKSINWNINDNAYPMIFVNAYAAQADTFGSALATVDAYVKQWGGLNGEFSLENPLLADTWDGTVDVALFSLDSGETLKSDTDEFVIMTAEQLAGFAKMVDNGNTFEGKTVKLGKNIDLANVLFEPIGSYKKDLAFKGTFDGQNYTIANMSQNTWELDNGYYYDDLGLGLFGLVEDATIKNLNMDGASISGESALSGTVAAAAYGNMVFENITVTNSEVADYQYYAGGIVAWASGDHQYINCDVDATTTIAAQWGDFDNSTGGLIGGAGGSATIYIKDCDIACRIDAYNDVTSSYQWYAYRRCGMIIGNTGKTTNVDGTTYAAAPQLTAENCTVTYGDWANYTYCEFAGKNWPYVRVQAGVSNSAYSNPRYGHPTDANGNEVVDDNHVHNDGEDHFILCTFDQLYGGGQGVYGWATHDGVTVIYNNK